MDQLPTELPADITLTELIWRQMVHFLVFAFTICTILKHGTFGLLQKQAF